MYYYSEVIIMPSEKKRINLTVPDGIYEKLQRFKAENGIESDATACMQLIVKQLKSQEEAKMMMDILHKIPKEEWNKIAALGVEEMKALADANASQNQ